MAAGALADKGSPVVAARDRGKFIQQALRDALVGLAALHGAELLHCALAPDAVQLSQVRRAALDGWAQWARWARCVRR